MKMDARTIYRSLFYTRRKPLVVTRTYLVTSYTGENCDEPFQYTQEFVTAESLSLRFALVRGSTDRAANALDDF